MTEGQLQNANATPPSPVIKVAIIEDESDIREGLALIIRAGDGFNCMEIQFQPILERNSPKLKLRRLKHGGIQTEKFAPG